MANGSQGDGCGARRNAERSVETAAGARKHDGLLTLRTNHDELVDVGPIEAESERSVLPDRGVCADAFLVDRVDARGRSRKGGDRELAFDGGRRVGRCRFLRTSAARCHKGREG